MHAAAVAEHQVGATIDRGIADAVTLGASCITRADVSASAAVIGIRVEVGAAQSGVDNRATVGGWTTVVTPIILSGVRGGEQQRQLLGAGRSAEPQAPEEHQATHCEGLAPSAEESQVGDGGC